MVHDMKNQFDKLAPWAMTWLKFRVGIWVHDVWLTNWFKWYSMWPAMCGYNWPNLDKNTMSEILGLQHVQISSAIPLLRYSTCFDVYLDVENCQTDPMSMFWSQHCVFITYIQLSGKLLYPKNGVELDAWNTLCHSNTLQQRCISFCPP